MMLIFTISLGTLSYQRDLSALKSLFWNYITVVRLLEALSKSSTRSLDLLNLELEYATAGTCLFMLLLCIYVFHLTFGNFGLGFC